MASASAEPAKNLSDWHTPSTRPEVIHDLIHGVDRYNPTNLPFLEEYLGTQVKEGQYDLFANLAILKLYQFNPSHSNPDIIINILIKALSASVHGPDYNLCLGLLREPSAILQDVDSEDESLSLIMPFLQQLHELSRTCQFTKFWNEYNGESEAANVLRSVYAPQHPDLEDQFRLIFSTTFASAFSRINVAQIGRWLNLPSNKVGEWASRIGWTVEGDVAVIPKNADNSVKAGVVKENVQLNQLTKLVAAAAY